MRHTSCTRTDTQLRAYMCASLALRQSKMLISVPLFLESVEWCVGDSAELKQPDN